MSWSTKEVDYAYNLGSGIGGASAIAVNYFTKTVKPSFMGMVLVFFAGVGAGGTVTYGYLYQQGVYK